MASTPSRRDPGTGPDQGPLVGDGGSADEVGWDEPTRPDRPVAPGSEPDARQGAAGGRDERAPGEPEPGDAIDDDTR